MSSTLQGTWSGRLSSARLGVELGDRRQDFLTVATYPRRNAYPNMLPLTRVKGATRIPLANGGLAFCNKSRPTSVYFTYPGGKYQVEVYDPSPERARALVRNGDIAPLGGRSVGTATATGR